MVSWIACKLLVVIGLKIFYLLISVKYSWLLTLERGLKTGRTPSPLYKTEGGTGHENAVLENRKLIKVTYVTSQKEEISIRGPDRKNNI